MGLFKNQLANVVEWEEYRDDVIFYKWNNSEIKKGSRLIIRPGQDAIFLYNGVTEGVFEKEGNYDIESDIMPFLSTLKGFKFGFNSGIRAEVIFINTKEFTMKWGTKQAVNLPTPALPGGMPIRANGTFQFKVGSYQMLIDKVAGEKKEYPEGLTVKELIEKEDVETPQYVTVTINDEFVESGAFESTEVKDGDEIEFLYFMGGGAR